MYIRSATIIAMLVFVSACASKTYKTSEIEHIQADCSNVEQTIVQLNKERGSNLERVKAGVQSVIPVSAALNIVTGNYKENVSMATGEWGKKIDAKLVEMNALKAQCDAAH